MFRRSFTKIGLPGSAAQRQSAVQCQSAAQRPLGCFSGKQRPIYGFVRLWQFRNLNENAGLSPSERGPLGREPRLSRVEAVLFLARETLSSRKIAQLANLANGNEARKLIRRLRQLYDAGSSAFQVEEVGGGYQLFSRPTLSPWLRRLLQTSMETRLSAPAMETLAVVAYRQPVLRVEIEAVRGVHCDEILRQLLERDLIRIVGRSEDLGRPLLYGTTKRFLELFGLRHLDELPKAAEFKAAGQKHSEVDQSADQTTDSNTGAGRNENTSSTDPTLEEKSVTTSIRPATIPAELTEEPLEALSLAARLPAGNRSLSAAKNGDEEEDEVDDEEDEEDDDWEDDEDEDEEDDDFVDEEWEEVDDDDEDDDEEDDEDDDEEWEDDDEEDEEWEDDDEEDEEDEKWEDDKK
ncbi:MAG TPA: SMC-Scp complex subunit ScpB [Pirellulales bacterium]|jgi:segregation and condensation protein B|nr:SMC-Scp complex subunit ScpB [Pirellulales bacterium]